jgi:hypothetical protein
MDTMGRTRSEVVEGCNVMYWGLGEEENVRWFVVHVLWTYGIARKVGMELVSRLSGALGRLRRDNVTPLFKICRLIRDSVHMTIWAGQPSDD